MIFNDKFKEEIKKSYKEKLEKTNLKYDETVFNAIYETTFGWCSVYQEVVNILDNCSPTTILNNKKSDLEAAEECLISILALKKQVGMKKEDVQEIKDKLFRAGILDENGELDKPYRNDN